MASGLNPLPTGITPPDNPPLETPLRLLFRGTVWNGVNVAAGRLIPSALIIVLAWWLEPWQLGAVSFVVAAFTILSLAADWSIAYAVQKLIPENTSQAGRIAWTALFLRFSFSILLGACCWGLDVATNVFHGYGGYLALMLVASSFGLVSFIHNASYNFSAASLIGTAVPFVWLIAALSLVRAGMPVGGPLVGLCIAYTAVGVPAILLSPTLRQQVGFVRPVALEILRYGIWATVASVLIGVAGQVGVLVLAYLEGNSAAAVFKVAATFAAAPAMFGAVVLLPLMPIAKRRLLDGQDVSALTRQVLDYLLLIGLPIFAAGFALAPSIIHSFVTESYRGAIWPLRILLGANILRMVVTALSGILLVGEGLRELAGIHGAAAAVALIGSLVLIRWAGLEGVAVALLLSWIVAAVLLYRWFEQRTPLQLEWRRYLQYGGSAVVMAMVAFLAAHLVSRPLEKLALGLSLATAVYSLLLWTQGVPTFEKLAAAILHRFVGED
jgi:O-antigen/teichoic acid export membrane protein